MALTNTWLYRNVLKLQSLTDVPALLASDSTTWISPQSASECSRHSCRKRAWVREMRLRRDSKATVCSHSFQPLNQPARMPTWSRNIMVAGTLGSAATRPRQWEGGRVKGNVGQPPPSHGFSFKSGGGGSAQEWKPKTLISLSVTDTGGHGRESDGVASS